MITNKLKYNNYLGGLLIAVLIFSFASCTDDFDALNTPSDQLTAENLNAANLGQAFAQSQFHGAHGAAGGGGFQIGQNLFADLWGQYYSTTAENFDSDTNVEVGGWANAAWNYIYGTPAPQIQFVEEFTANENMAIENAIAKIWRIQIFHKATDYWGPIIYSEFGNGEVSVAYDSQEDVYNRFFTELDEAVSVLESNLGAGNAFNDHDLVYGGDERQWLTFANSIRLRLAMRIRYVNPTLAQEEAEKAVLAGVMEDNSDNALVLTTENNKNPKDLVTGWGEFRMSASMESLLKGYDDPRLEDYFEPADDGEFRGLRNGIPSSGKGSFLNSMGSDVDIKWQPIASGGTNPDIEIMNAAEMYFLRAEGALLNWDMGGTAQELYEQGIRTSMQDRSDRNDAVTITESQIDAYIASSNIPADISHTHPDWPSSWDISAATDIPVAFESGASEERRLEQIITQKWLAVYPNGFEAYAEVRRTGYPQLLPRLSSQNNRVGPDETVRRMTFVGVEYSNNASAVEAAIQLLDGPDENDTKVWWDAKP